MNIARLALALSLLAVLIAPGRAEGSERHGPDHSLGGYLRVMPGVDFTGALSDSSFNLLVHNRLNYRLDFSGNTTLRAECRNRLIYRRELSDLPEDRSFRGRDEGLADLSLAWASQGGWLGHSTMDRLHLEHDAARWNLVIGRQRVNWGINLVSNPNDLFNTYSWFDYDHPERPGSDALRARYFPDHLSSVEFAAAAGRGGRNRVFALNWRLNRRGYDFQFLAGRYRERIALGAGWAGNLGEAGFKGEATWFRDRHAPAAGRRSNIVAAAGLDYMFANGTFGVLELLYNGGHGRAAGAGPLRADDIMFSRFALTVSADRAFSPLVTAGVSVMSLPDIRAFFLTPSFRRSLAPDLDLEIAARVFAGGSESALDNARSTVHAAFHRAF